MQPFTRLLLAFSCLLVLCITTHTAIAQKNLITGKIVDTAEKKALHHSIVALIDLKDTTLYQSIRADENGDFEFTKIPSGRYTLMVSYPKMADYLKDIIVKDTSQVKLGKLSMITEAKLLEEVVVTAGVPIRMKGDTLEYTADSFAVKPGANVEELLKRLPGMYMERNGKIYAQGKEVEKVLVDGDEFFSDDPGLAAKYLRADAIDKVQVFDQKSEQTEFTGIDDGKRTKTINLKLKKSKRNGAFGKLSTGSNGKEYYQHEAMGALFNNTRKVSVFGLSSKGAGTRLGYSEMSKYVNQDYEMIDDGTGNIVYHSNYDGDENYYGDGLPSILYGGAHFSDKWNSSKQKLFANYRTRQTKVTSWNTSNGISVLPDGSSFKSASRSNSDNYSFFQKASGSLALSLDSFSTIKISLSGRTGNGNRSNINQSSSANGNGITVNDNESADRNVNDSKQFGSNISYQRKFRKEGRTLSLTFQQDYNNRNNDAYVNSITNYYDPVTGVFNRKDSLNQLQRSQSPYETYAAKAQYTDAVNKKILLSAEYGYKKTFTSNVFNTYKNNNGKYDQRIDSISNDYDFAVATHITGTSVTFHNKKLSINAGAKAFFSDFTQENNDLKAITSRNFINWAPAVSAIFRFKQNASINTSYSGETGQPSVEQLQPLRRTSNNLYVMIGNPDLKPRFRHAFNFTYQKYNYTTGASLYGYLSMSVEQNSITSQSTIDAQNRTVSQYINIKGLPGYNGYISYNWNYKKWHLRPNVSTSFGKNANYMVQNGKRLRSESLNLNTSVGLSHEWKDVMNTSYSARIGYNRGTSDIQGSKTNTTFNHAHTITNSIYLPWKIELESDCEFTFQPKNSTFNTNFNNINWNASIQKKFLKNDQGIIKLAVNDVLNRKTGYSRSVYGSNFNESDRFVIKRYFLLSATWNFTRSL